MPSVGFLIYAGVMPLVKMFITIFFGFVLARKDLFTPAASKGVSQVTMNIALPALIFSNIVPAFTPSNVSAIGPLALIAVVYVLFGFLFGYLIREVCYVPRNFWQGIIVATGLSNWGNLPNAVVLSVTTQSPFNPAIDPALGVSFVAIFICVYHIFFWVVGVSYSLSWDYKPGVPQGEDAERRVSWKEKPIGGFIARKFLRYRPRLATSREIDEKPAQTTDLIVVKSTTFSPSSGLPVYEEGNELGSRTSRQSVRSFRSGRLSVVAEGATLPAFLEQVTDEHLEQVDAEEPQPHSNSFIPPIVYRTLRAVSVIVTPITITIAVALPISLIIPLKALFVDTTAVGGPSWKGPDGRPPLVFILDTANFVGTLAVPLALILLGASFARLKIPRPISRLPIPAMLSVCIAKMVVLPVIGVFMVRAMTKQGLISIDSKAEVFVAMFLSGTPSAVNQLIVSSLYSPTGDLDTLSAFLLIQYVFMFFSSAALTAVSLLLM